MEKTRPVTVYPRMPQDRAGCVARYTQAEEVREGGIPEATEIYCQSELAKNRQGEAHLVAVRRLHAGAA